MYGHHALVGFGVLCGPLSPAIRLSACTHVLLQGLTHTGAISCKIADDGKTIMRDPQFCKPDWYGDHTSFMGSSPTLQIPSAIKYKVTWHLLHMDMDS